MMRHLYSLAFATLLSIAGFSANAQSVSGGLIPLDIRILYSNATGRQDAGAHVLWTESFAESDEAHGIIKYGTGYRGHGPLYGLLRFNGEQALPCEYEQLYLSQENYIAVVLPDATHAYLYDWNMKCLPTADICYTEPWTRNGITYYPAIDRNGKVGVYDDSGRLVVPFKYDISTWKIRL